MSSLAMPVRLVRDALTSIGQAWSWFWFQETTTAPLEVVRIGIGALVLFHFGMGTPFLFQLWGNDGWMTLAGTRTYITGPWEQSVFFYFTAPWQWIAFHAVFLFCTAAFMAGWRTPFVKWVVLLGQVSYDYRNLTLAYGVDSIMCGLLTIMCLAPVGRAMSLDRVRAVRAAKRRNLAATLPPYASQWAGACTRLLQLQMATLFLFSALGKFRADEWWTGDGIWLAFTTYEFYNPWLLEILARQYWLVNLMTYGTLLIETSYVFLIWQRRTRPYLLSAAIFLHVMFILLLRLVYFGIVMIVGHLIFLRPEWLTRWGEAWKRTMGDMEMIYDGRCGFCVRSMAWLLAFDGLRQIRIRNFRADPSPLVKDALVEKALYAVLPDGRALPGFEAYRYVVLRVPGLWWLVPFFYIPVVSRLVGHPLYNWVAANRTRLSTLTASA
jgi:predicted DCC family thiol-disulfide oxidoreductase YuxK